MSSYIAAVTKNFHIGRKLSDEHAHLNQKFQLFAIITVQKAIASSQIYRRVMLIIIRVQN